MSEAVIVYGYFLGCRRVETIDAVYKMTKCKTPIRINKNIACDIEDMTILEKTSRGGHYLRLIRQPKDVEYGIIDQVMVSRKASLTK